MPEENLQLYIAENDGERLDVWLTSLADVPSRSRAKKMIEDGHVFVNGLVPGKAGVKLTAGDVIEVRVPTAQPEELIPEPIPLDIVYEDTELIIVNKRRGMVVHPAPGHERGTLVNALIHYFPDLPHIDEPMRPGMVHRLDKDTTGLLVVGKTEKALRSLKAQLQARTMTREYVAVVHGTVKPTLHMIDAPVGRHPVHRKKMAVTESGRSARTRLEVLKHGARHSFVRLGLETGRTHQLRVHLAFVGHPVVGDETYGSKERLSSHGGYALHAQKLGLVHPATGDLLTVEASTPGDFDRLLEKYSLRP